MKKLYIQLVVTAIAIAVITLGVTFKGEEGNVNTEITDLNNEIGVVHNESILEHNESNLEHSQSTLEHSKSTLVMSLSNSESKVDAQKVNKGNDDKSKAKKSEEKSEEKSEDKGTKAVSKSGAKELEADSNISDNDYSIEGASEDNYDGDYIIYVNRDQNFVRINRIDENGAEKIDRIFTCSCGRSGHNTPKGTFKTSDKYEWRLMVDGTYARYCVRFNNKILFHSVPYLRESPDTLEWDQYNLLGNNASLGCVRLCVRDAKWIYDHCKQGTTVVVYTNDEDPTVYYKPNSIYIHAMSDKKGWDPTDTDPASPWNNIN